MELRAKLLAMTAARESGDGQVKQWRVVVPQWCKDQIDEHLAMALVNRGIAYGNLTRKIQDLTTENGDPSAVSLRSADNQKPASSTARKGHRDSAKRALYPQISLTVFGYDGVPAFLHLTFLSACIRAIRGQTWLSTFSLTADCADARG